VTLAVATEVDPFIGLRYRPALLTGFPDWGGAAAGAIEPSDGV
jgi:hypothetical protein